MKLNVIAFLKQCFAKLFQREVSPGLYDTGNAKYKNLAKKVPYVVYVGMEDFLVLAREQDIVPLFLKEFEDRTPIGWTPCACECNAPEVPIFGFYREFFLGSEELFPKFKEIMLSISGVTSVVKGNGPWKKTVEELEWEKNELREVRQKREIAQKESAETTRRELNEFIELLDSWGMNDGEEGEEKKQGSRMDRAELEGILQKIGECSVEGVVAVCDHLAGHFTYKRIVLDASNGMEAVRLLETAMNSALSVPFVTPKISFFNVPFRIAHRIEETGNQLFFCVSCGRVTFQMGDYFLFIREKQSSQQNAN